MKVRILYFGVLKDLLGGEGASLDGELLELPADATVAWLIAQLRARTPRSGTIWETLAVAINRQYASVDTPLHDGDELALLPPVSGG
jgi:molybdopterin converting factor small subunit